jgi:hypothetical protein
MEPDKIPNDKVKMNSSPIKRFTFVDKLKVFFNNRTNLILTAGLAVLVIAAIWGGVSIFGKKLQGPLQDVDLAFNPTGPYALLSPRRDGNAINLDITRVGEYDAISYELAYQSVNPDASASADEGGGQATINRGVTGDIKTDNKQNEYKQEILFGTCSRGNTMDPLHCVFDTGVENGTLTLHIVKGNIRYNMATTWHFQKPDVALGVLTSADSHFKYVVQGASESANLATPAPTPVKIAVKTPKTTPAPIVGSGFPDDLRQKLSLVGYSLINDLSGVPKLPNGKEVSGKVYALNVPDGKDFLGGMVTIELADNPPANAKIGFFKVDGDSWQMLDTTINGSTLTAPAPNAGIFAVLIDTQAPAK